MRSYIPALHHHTAFSTKGTLAFHHPGPYTRMHTDPRRRFRYVLFADARRYIFVIEKNSIAIVRTGLQNDLCGFGQSNQCGFFIQRGCTFNRLQRQRTIHCSALQIEKSEVTRKMRGDCTLARASRTVNRNHWAQTPAGGRHFFFPLFLPPLFLPRGRFVREAATEPFPPRGFLAQNGFAPGFPPGFFPYFSPAPASGFSRRFKLSPALSSEADRPAHGFAPVGLPAARAAYDLAKPTLDSAPFDTQGFAPLDLDPDDLNPDRFAA
jgi:hypothetical protein